ncbi:MAG: carbamate kinase [Actinobacteria bacterium]|nr:carbamate kinase [Actinomycetota bacterium]
MRTDTVPADADRRRTVVALGGNAIAPAGTGGTAEEQTRNIRRAMDLIAELIVDGREIVITHGNGPQVGNLLRKNEMAKDVVPPMPLDWCVAQTQATIGYQMITALEHALEAHGDLSTVVPVISRVEVSADDPAWSDPSKPIGPFITDADEVERRRREDGHDFVDLGERGWRRVVPSPQPLRLLESMTINLLLDAGAVVVANGGGGIPMVRTGDNLLSGVEAVIDKDLAGALLARQLHATGLVILTDVDGVAIDFGSPQERWLSKVTASELRAHADDGEFARGSMGPKVAAALSFVEHAGMPAAIGALDDVLGVVRGESGTLIVPDDAASGDRS